MTRITVALSTIMLLTILAACETRAQTPAPSITGAAPTKAPVIVAQPTAEQKSKLSALAKAWNQKLQEADSARKDYVMELLNTLAELGLKPSETSVSWNERGEPVFNRVEPPKPTAQNTPSKEAKP